MTVLKPHFSNRYTRLLPGESGGVDPRRPRQVAGAAWSPADCTPVSAPVMLAWNETLSQDMGLDVPADKRAVVFAGNQLLPGMQPYAACYGGHQFGQWAGQLGDGRVINLGEWQGPDARYWSLQLKGAGPTPYSRFADGRAVLRSSVREYLCSEAMYHLGVPTTRALSLVVTGDTVVRDMFYDGNPQSEPGAIVCRVAGSFVRFGHFELAAARGDHTLLHKLLAFSIRTEWPSLADRLDASSHDAQRAAVYLDWYRLVGEATLDLVMHWMRVGFVHGVMNTDNMASSAITIDYGPYGWIDDYQPDWTPNTSDRQHRYCFAQQGNIARWNLYRLANAIFPVVGDAAALQSLVDSHERGWTQRYHAMMAGKLGLPERTLVDGAFLTLLDSVLQVQETDMTLFFRALADFAAPGDTRPLHEVVATAFYQGSLQPDNLPLYQQLDAEYRARLSEVDREQRQRQMNNVNPCYIPRNYLVQQAIDQLMIGDRTEFDQLLRLIQAPYLQQSGMSRYAERRPDWARSRAGCSMLSCSS